MIPSLLILLSLLFLFSKKDLASAFLRGATHGLRTAAGLLPPLILLLIATRMLSVCGFSEYLTSLLSPVLSRIGIPSELVPLLLLRPFSGSASYALLTDLFGRVGPDSFAGLCASVLVGSSDTVFYIVCLYLSSVGIKKGRGTLFLALSVSLFAVFFSCLCVRWLLC